MAFSMAASRMLMANAPASVSPAQQRRPAMRSSVVVCSASQDSRQSFAQVAARSLMAFSLAAGLAMAPAPAQAKDVLFYGRPGPIAAKKAEFEALKDQAEAALEAAQTAKAKKVILQAKLQAKAALQAAKASAQVAAAPVAKSVTAAAKAVVVPAPIKAAAAAAAPAVAAAPAAIAAAVAAPAQSLADLVSAATK